MAGIGNYDVQYTLILHDKMTKVLKQAENATKGFNSYVTAGGNQLASMFSKGNIAMGVMAGGIALVGKAIKEAMDFEQVQVQMEVMLGSVDKARVMLKDIEDFAIKTPFESKDLLDSTKILLNFGVAEKKIMPVMKQLGDISMGDSEKLHRMSVAFGQMSSAGRLMGQDLLQMINAGFNPLQEISKRTGKTMAELRKEMERGNISVEMVEQAFADATGAGGRFNGMMDKQSATMGGQWSTAMDKFHIALRDMGGKVLPQMTQGLSGINQMMSGKNIGKGYLDYWIGFQKTFNPIVIGWSAVIGKLDTAFGKTDKVKNNFFDLHTTMQMIAKSSLAQLSYGLDNQAQLIETAASMTDNNLTAALDRAQKMYGITSAQIDIFMGKVREQQDLMGGVGKKKDMSEMNLEELNKMQEGFQNSQKLSGNRKEFLKDQKEIDKIQKRMDAITGKSSVSSKGGSGGGGTTISSRAPQYFTITIDQLVGTINTKKESFNESDTETKKQVTEALVGALNDTQLIGK